MRRVILLAVVCGFTFFSFLISPVASDGQQPKKKEKAKIDTEAFAPSAEVMKQIEAKTEQLAAKIADLQKSKNPKVAELLPDVEIYLRGARNIVRFKEWYNKASGQWTLDALDRGLERAGQLAKGQAPWTTLQKSNVLRAYRSAIDGKAQPYGVTYPSNYRDADNGFCRVDIVLHGRSATLTEVAFLNQHNGKKQPSTGQDWVQIDIFGRGNNAYRWSGETDVMEAIEAFFRNEARAKRMPGGTAYRRIVLRGFSMGGAGTWHLGLHHPTMWRVMGPGAGFTTTHGYAWKEKKDLPDYQERCLRIYDAIDYVENARMIPIVAFSGGDDPQKLAADNIENRLKELKINAMTHLVKPGVGHKFEDDYFKKANALWAKEIDKEWKPRATLSFVTYTLKYRVCDWIYVDALEKHYVRATIEASLGADPTKGWNIKTKNVRALTILGSFGGPHVNLTVDNQALGRVAPQGASIAKDDGKWDFALNRNFGTFHIDPKAPPEKLPGLQGPIDDAFTGGFVCVTGTGKTWHPATQDFVDAKVKAFEFDWAKHWRGELPITNEYGVSPNEIKEKHLILFGDPSSNFLLANILDKLPIKWTKDEIEFAGKKYKSSEHVPVMIFPNPLNPQKYVVLNTGHTIPSEDYAKTNALLYPRLGDYAILKMAPTAKNAAAYEVATAGLFDEFWQVEKK